MYDAQQRKSAAYARRYYWAQFCSLHELSRAKACFRVRHTAFATVMLHARYSRVRRLSPLFKSNAYHSHLRFSTLSITYSCHYHRRHSTPLPAHHHHKNTAVMSAVIDNGSHRERGLNYAPGHAVDIFRAAMSSIDRAGLKPPKASPSMPPIILTILFELPEQNTRACRSSRPDMPMIIADTINTDYTTSYTTADGLNSHYILKYIARDMRGR